MSSINTSSHYAPGAIPIGEDPFGLSRNRPPAGDVKFQVMIENNDAIKSVMQSKIGFSVDAKKLTELLNESVEGIVLARMEQYGFEKLVKDTLERRVEVAVKTAAGKLEAQIAKWATEAIRDRVIAEVAKMDLHVSLEPRKDGN